ncbi:MAG: M14 family zinc carboxypeptidase [Nocardioides sp.]
MSCFSRPSLAAAVVLTAATVSPVLAPASAGSAVESVRRPAVIGTRVIGHSVKGRAIRAWHLGHRHRTKVVLLAAMHGNETAPRRILWNLRDGAPVRGINLWVVPTYNPDGVARGTRQNARHVDLNRNYPFKWAHLSGSYYSGTKPASEPETRAVMRFLSDVKPAYVLSFHQPFHSVDLNNERPAFSRRVARALHLPTENLDCGGSCHGTMTQWYNHRFKGFALTVEYGAHPGVARMRRAANQVLGIFDARR